MWCEQHGHLRVPGCAECIRLDPQTRIAELEAENERLRKIITVQMVDGRWWLKHKTRPGSGCLCFLCSKAHS